MLIHVASDEPRFFKAIAVYWPSIMEVEFAMLVRASSETEAESTALTIGKEAYHDFVGDALDQIFDKLAQETDYYLVHDEPNYTYSEELAVEEKHKNYLQSILVNESTSDNYYHVYVNIPVEIANVLNDSKQGADVYTLWQKVHKKKIPCEFKEPLGQINYQSLAGLIVTGLNHLKINMAFKWDILEVTLHSRREGTPHFETYSEAEYLGNIYYDVDS
jgi:hypothetical protein